jgi:hypothetical protein
LTLNKTFVGITFSVINELNTSRRPKRSFFRK